MNINIVKEVINEFYNNEKIIRINLKLKNNSDIHLYRNFIDSISIYHESLKVFYTEQRYLNCTGIIRKSSQSSINYYNIIDIIAITLDKQSEIPENIDKQN